MEGDIPSQAAKTPTLDVQLQFVAPTFVVIFLALCTLHKFRPLPTLLFPNEEGKWRFTQPNWLSWISSASKSNLQDIFAHCGPDGPMLFVFIEMVLKFFCFATVLCISCILPIHVVSSNVKNFNSIYTIESVQPKSRVFFVHLCVCWVLILAFHYFLYQAYRKAIAIQRWQVARSNRASKSVLVSGIDPKESEEDLKTYFNSLHIGQVDQVTILRRSPKLEAALAERWKWLDLIEKLASKYPTQLIPLVNEWLAKDSIQLEKTQSNAATLASPSSTSPPRLSPTDTFTNSYKNDSFSRLTSKLNTLNPFNHSSSSSPSPNHPHPFPSSTLDTLVDTEPLPPPPPSFWKFWVRMPLEQVLLYYYKKFILEDTKVRYYRSCYGEMSTPISAAIVTFHHPASSTLATQCVLHPDLFKLAIQRIPEPPDFFFTNLGLKPVQSLLRKYLHMACLFALMCLWTFPVVALTALFNLETLSKRFPELIRFFQAYPFLNKLAQSVLPTLGLTIFMAVLPYILTFFSSFRCFASKARLSISVFASFFLFQFFFVFLAFTLSGPLFQFFNPEFLNFDKVIHLLATSLPTASYFFLNYIILHIGSVLPLSLIPIGSIVMYLLFPPKTPRQKHLAKLRTPFVPSDLTFTVLIWIIGLVYSVLCPVMLIPCLLYSVLVWFVWRYKLLYQVSMVDSRGQLFVYLTHMWYVGPWFFLLLMLGQFSLKEFPWAFLLLPLVGLHAYTLYWIRQFDRKLITVPLESWRTWVNDTTSFISHTSETMKSYRCPYPDFQSVLGIDGLPSSYGQTDLLGSLPRVWVPSSSSSSSSPTSPSSSSSSQSGNPTTNVPSSLTYHSV